MKSIFKIFLLAVIVSVVGSGFAPKETKEVKKELTIEKVSGQWGTNAILTYTNPSVMVAVVPLKAFETKKSVTSFYCEYVCSGGILWFCCYSSTISCTPQKFGIQCPQG